MLVVQYSANLDGSAFSALMLVDGLRKDGWETHVAFGFEGGVIAHFRAAAHHTHVVEHKNWLRTRHHLYFARNVIKEVQAVRAFERLMKQVRPDLVYVNTSVSLAGALAAYRRGIPQVWHLRELFSDVGGELKVPVGLKGVVRWVFRKLATRLVVNSEAVAANVLGRTGEDLDVVPNAASTVFFEECRGREEARAIFGLPNEACILGIPGTLRPMKGHPFFFRAVVPVVERHPELLIAVTGSGPSAYENELAEQVRRLGLDKQVRFLGSIRDMPAFYRACDLACIPSRAEPFGRTVIEAFATGVPIVATAVGGIRETVTDGETGLLVQYGNEAEMAAALERMLADADLRERLRRRARREAERHYHETVYQERINRIVGALGPSVRYSNPVPLSPTTYPGVAHDEL